MMENPVSKQCWTDARHPVRRLWIRSGGNIVRRMGTQQIANNVDPHQMPHYVASDLGLHCLPMTLLRVSREEWFNTAIHTMMLLRCLCCITETELTVTEFMLLTLP